MAIATNSEAERLLSALAELQAVLDGEPEQFATDCEPATLHEVIEAWQATNMLSDMFLQRVKAAHGMADN